MLQRLLPAALTGLLALASCGSDKSSPPALALGSGKILVQTDTQSLRKIAFVIRGATLGVTNLFGVEFRLQSPVGARLSDRTVLINETEGCFMAAAPDQVDPTQTCVVVGALGPQGVLSGDIEFGRIEFDLPFDTRTEGRRANVRNPGAERPVELLDTTSYLGGAPVLIVDQSGRVDVVVN